MTAGLLAVLVIAKLAVLAGRPLTFTPWLPFAYFWQDAAVLTAFGSAEFAARRFASGNALLRWALRCAYLALVILVAVNVPVERVLSSPLTAPMLHAARGTLADSILAEASALNLGLGGMVVAAAILPLWRRSRISIRFGWLAAGAAFSLAGSAAAQHVDTGGLDRNALVALVRSSLPRVRAAAATADWRARIGGIAGGTDLTALRGTARGANVLLVVLESTGAEYLAPWGAPDDPMPRLSSLAARSVLFDAAYAAYPESIKGLVATLASRYPAFDVPVERHAALMRTSLPSLLAMNGYRTGLFHSGRFMYLGMDTVLSRAGFGALEDAGDIGGNHSSSFGIDEPATVHRILQWIDNGPPRQPFFAAFLPIAAHHPYAFTGPATFGTDTPIERYRNALGDADRALGLLLDGLQERGLAASTLVVVIADHGEAFAQHPGNIGHDLALYEENVRVPMLFHLPGQPESTVHSATVASLLDLAPTVLDLLGVAAPQEFQGESLLAGRSRMALFFTDYSLGLLGLRDGCMKDVYELESGRTRMYDLCRDPDEEHDIEVNEPARAAAYRARLQAWSADQVARVSSGAGSLPQP